MLADTIRKLMKEHGLTQAQLAKKASVSQSSISAILNGAEPRPITLAAIAHVLGTTAEELSATETIPERFRCPSCGSSVVLTWKNLATGACRFRCGFCNADSQEQSSVEKAYSVFLGFKRAESAEAELLHVLSLDELLDWACFDSDAVRPVWFENRGLFIAPALLQCDRADRENAVVRVSRFNSFGATSYYWAQYGSWWRVWSDRPTQAISDSVPWKEP